MYSKEVQELGLNSEQVCSTSCVLLLVPIGTMSTKVFDKETVNGKISSPTSGNRELLIIYMQTVILLPL